MRLWITAVFFLLSSTNFVSVKWGNILNINKINKNALCPPEPYLKPAALLKPSVNSHQPGNIRGLNKNKRPPGRNGFRKPPFVKLVFKWTSYCVTVLV